MKKSAKPQIFKRARPDLSGESMRGFKRHRNFLALLILGAVVLGMTGYARWIEPSWIEVSRYSLGGSPTMLRVAQLSDLHIRKLGSRELKILEILRHERPDAILITGDSIAENANYSALGEFLSHLQAPLGIWLIRGNWEHWRPSEEETEIYRNAKVNFLDNSSAQLTEGVWLIGVDDEMAGQPDLKLALKDVPRDSFKIGLFHSPAFFDQTKTHFNLALSGHTHGGQIRLPFLPPFWLPEGSGRFVSGWYMNGDSRIYVSGFL